MKKFTDEAASKLEEAYSKVRDEHDDVRRAFVAEFAKTEGYTVRQIIGKLSSSKTANYKAYTTQHATKKNEADGVKKATAKDLAAQIVVVLALDAEFLLPLTRTSKACLLAILNGVDDMKMVSGEGSDFERPSLDLPPMPEME